MKSFAIIGLSSFGYYMAKYLSENGFNVMAIDIEEDRIERVKSFVDRAVIIDATDRDTLAGLGLADLDAVIVSLGDRMDAGILVTMYLRELKVKHIIAKALTEDHGKILNMVGATQVVFPERDEAVRLAKTLESEYVLDTIHLGDNMSIIEVAPPKSFVGQTLDELDLRNRYGALVLVIKEIIPNNQVVIPTADHLVTDTSILLLLGRDEDLAKIKKMK